LKRVYVVLGHVEKGVRNGNPTKQGLKPTAPRLLLTANKVRNGNPTKQGLKLLIWDTFKNGVFGVSETEIQQNKD